MTKPNPGPNFGRGVRPLTFHVRYNQRQDLSIFRSQTPPKLRQSLLCSSRCPRKDVARRPAARIMHRCRVVPLPRQTVQNRIRPLAALITLIHFLLDVLAPAAAANSILPGTTEVLQVWNGRRQTSSSGFGWKGLPSDRVGHVLFLLILVKKEHARPAALNK